jgi:FtsP/CotA-like multicopper oxidase with cupredoxin domain
MRQLKSRFTRRGLLLGAGAAGATAFTGRSLHAQPASPSSASADYTIKVAPVSLEIAPGKVIKTTAYNGTVPGPALRLQEGKPVTLKVINDSGYPNLVHWHGLMIPSMQDGATEEGSPIIPPGNSLLYTFKPNLRARAGIIATRWR